MISPYIKNILWVWAFTTTLQRLWKRSRRIQQTFFSLGKHKQKSKVYSKRKRKRSRNYEKKLL